MEAFERVARAAVQDASTVLRATWREAKTVHHKGAVDIVTETDHEVEALIVSHLRRAFPEHLIVAEEAAAGRAPASPPSDRHVWYLDPLDGTTNFAHAYPHFAVSLALARGTEMLFGIVHDPVRDETFIAHPGGGARLNDQPIGVSAVVDLDDALLATGFPYDRRQHTGFYLGFLADFMCRAQGVRRNGSAALDLCWVACGRLDGFWEWKLQPWDTAAGSLVVREAGGIVSDFRGGTFDLYGQQTLASNGALHEAMVGVLTARLGDGTVHGASEDRGR
jgi:myo-inositol-1(or 4)-monophosphatase